MREIQKGLLNEKDEELFLKENFKNKKEDIIKKELEIHISTLLVGGGYENGEIDEVTPIRGGTIKGHLRFWWRATRGRLYKDAEKLYEKESEIFGSSEKKSKVRLFIKRQPNLSSDKYNNIENWNELRDNIEKIEYVMFPFKGSRKEEPKRILLNSSFELEIEYPKEYEDDVECALWSWINFGGIGARTRRGCGTLYCKEYSPTSDDNLSEWLNKKFDDYELNNYINEEEELVTLNGNNIYIKMEILDPLRAWDDVIYLYWNFRQGEIGRNYFNNKPKRSKWTEPDSIRLITKRWGKHEPKISDKEISFPRSEFGLPIIFRFHPKDRNEPPQSEVLPIGKERLSSPLILKPLMLSEKEAYPMVLVLDGPPIEKVRIKTKTKKIYIEYVLPEEITFKDSPLNYDPENYSAIESFLNYIKKEEKYIKI